MIMINRATEYLPGIGRKIRAKGSGAASAAQSEVRHLLNRAADCVGRNPGTSLAAASAAGAVIGWLVKRR